jgi:thioredoxin 2
MTTTDSVLIVCPHCAAINRLDPARAGKAACGKCGGQVFPAQVFELGAAAFERNIARNTVPVLVDFYSPTCGPCRMMAPQFAEAARMLHPAVRLFKVNTAEEQALAARFGIQSVPTLALFVNGREAARQPGALPAADIARWVQAQLYTHQAGQGAARGAGA